MAYTGRVTVTTLHLAHRTAPFRLLTTATRLETGTEWEAPVSHTFDRRANFSTTPPVPWTHSVRGPVRDVAVPPLWPRDGQLGEGRQMEIRVEVRESVFGNTFPSMVCRKLSKN